MAIWLVRAGSHGEYEHGAERKLTPLLNRDEWRQGNVWWRLIGSKR